MSAIEELLRRLGPDIIRTGDAIPERNRQDMSGYPAQAPVALALPRSTADVSAILTICHAHGQPVAPQGGLTGLAAGAIPGSGEVALSLERMSGVEEVDSAAGTLTALAGTPLAVIQNAADEAGFQCGVDLGARGSCSIGGNVATNAGGNQVLRYGMTRRNVLGLEVVLADGTVLTNLNKMLKNNTGYDWKELFVGSEGTLGVVTRVVLQLHPKLQGIETALVAVADVERAVTLLRRAGAALPGGLLAFEAMWREFMSIAFGRIGLKAPFAQEHELTVLMEAPVGTIAAGREAFEAFLMGVIDEGLALDCVMANSGADRARFWAYRESVYEYGPRGLPKMINFDIAIPLARMGEAVAAFRAELPRLHSDSLFVIFGHLADSNVHLNATREQGLDPEARKAIDDLVYGITARLGGSVSAEHGIGRSKKPYLELSRSADEIALMRRIKAALDPAGILSPGRVL